MILKLQFMQMATHPMPQGTKRIKLLNSWKNVLVICLHDLKIREIWKCHLLVGEKKNYTTVTSNNFKTDINGVTLPAAGRKNRVLLLMISFHSKVMPATFWAKSVKSLIASYINQKKRDNHESWYRFAIRLLPSKMGDT